MSDHATPPPADYTGRAVGGGRYLLQDLLGTGGMAAVHLAWDTVLERRVAVKTMHAELGREAAFRERFKREAQSVAKLTHTNIVSVFDTGEDRIDGAPVPYIVMEYIEGKPLRTVLEEDIARYGAMPPEKALSITADVLAALEISHEMGLVHRDIKPGNVMVTRRGVVKVMDFGIARAIQQSGVTAMTQTGMVVGTPQYLSPEQALGRQVDARADLYSVGVMLFELLTGRLPFDAESALAIAYAHVQEEPPRPSSINSSLSPAIDALIARMLAKNPNDRYPSAEVLRAEVQRLAGTASGVTPQIVPGAQTGNSGAGVAQAVFPDQGTPPQQLSGQPSTPATPYAATPTGGSYGYPHASTPPPGGGAGAPSTPPPYNTPAPGSGGSDANRNTLWVVVASVAAIALIAVVAVVVIVSNGGGDGGGGEPEAKGTETGEPNDNESGDADDEPSEEESPRYNPGDPNKTIDPSECTGATEYYDQEEHPNAVTMPDFYDVHIDSVKECIRAAGWQYDENLNYVDEVLKGEGMVIDQSPPEYEPYNPEEDVIELTVSTGKEPTD